MWKVVRVGILNHQDLTKYLEEGYEPFAATVDKYDYEAVWLKKKEKVISEVRH